MSVKSAQPPTLKLCAGAAFVGEKRQHIPYVLTWTCPECGVKHLKDFTVEYLSYPVFGKECALTLYCAACGWEKESVRLRVKITAELTWVQDALRSPAKDKKGGVDA